MCFWIQNTKNTYLSLIYGNPVCCGEPLVIFYVVHAILQIAKSLRKIYLEQVSQQILQVGAKVGWESNLREQMCLCRAIRNNAKVTLVVKKTSTLHVTFSAYLARHNLFVDLDRLIGKKWRVTGSHFIDKDSKRPPVHSFVVALEEAETGIKYIILHYL